MRFLRFDLYEGGNVGFFNNLMSLELGVGLSALSNRRLLLNYPAHPIFNSERQRTILDLVELSFPYQIGNFVDLPCEFLPDLHSTQIRLSDLTEVDRVPVLSTRNASTLGYYSYVLPADERVTNACNYLIAIREPYRRLASSIVKGLRDQHGEFASVHIRRMDFLNDYGQTELVSPEEIQYNMGCHIPRDCFLMIHSDEINVDYFAPILKVWPNHCLIDRALFHQFHPDTLDSAEIGLISALVACESDFFLGTMFSTFTGYIHRKRFINRKSGDFLYLYNQRPDCLQFRDGHILENGNSGPTWERIDMADDLRSICFWWREWPESGIQVIR